ncbi:MAG: hypothetical protein MMC33_003963 [Icmadophila ericetorum]|nr:hypothetical protein [Icmadophila ericetorum]
MARNFDVRDYSVEASLSPTDTVNVSSSLPFGRRGSAPDLQETCNDPAFSQDTELPHRTRSQSNADLPDRRDEWAKKILAGRRMQSAIADLIETKNSYQKDADQDGWDEIDQKKGDVVQKLQQLTAIDGWTENDLEGPSKKDKFSTIGFHYTQLYDVLLNQAPWYVGSAWSVIKTLLVARISHTRLKDKVEEALLHIANKLGIVHQVIGHIPTDAMATAVGALYASISKFLSQTLQYYHKSRFSKAARVFSAFGFPWEREFQWLVDKISQQISRIQDITSIGHLNATMECLHLARVAHEDEGNSRQLGASIKRDVNETLSGHFQRFEQMWVAKFEDLLAFALKREDIAMRQEDLIDSSLESDIFLADYISVKEKLPDFISMAFFELQDFRQNESRIRSLRKYLLDCDFEQCMRLLENEKIQAWLLRDASSIVWVNSHRTSPLADWATAMTTRLIDHAARLERVTVLRYFCMQHNRKNALSTAASLVQVLIFQILELNSHRFLVRSTQFTLERIKRMATDFRGLWAIFREVLSAATIGGPACIWLFIDCIDMLKVNDSKASGDLSTLLGYLDDLTKDDTMIVKILITARHTSVFQQLDSEIKSGKLPSFRNAVITIPRGRHQFTAALCAKNSKKLNELKVVAGPKKKQDPEPAEYSIESGNPTHDVFYSSDSSLPASAMKETVTPRLEVPQFVRTNVDSSEQDSVLSLDDLQSDSEPDWTTRGLSKVIDSSNRHSLNLSDESPETTDENPFEASGGSESGVGDEDVTPGGGDGVEFTTLQRVVPRTNPPADEYAIDDTSSGWSDSGPDI